MRFLTFAEIIEIHRDQISRYGGTLGIRDVELLKSAINIPMATYGGNFLHVGVFEMAAAYLYHLVSIHPFLDGNKRVGVVAALVFLLLNGFELDAPEDDLAEMVLSVARSELDKSEVACFIKHWSHPV